MYQCNNKMYEAMIKRFIIDNVSSVGRGLFFVAVTIIFRMIGDTKYHHTIIGCVNMCVYLTIRIQNVDS